MLEQEEIEAHFRGMPAHYWDRVTESDILEHLETIHGFLEKNCGESFEHHGTQIHWQAGSAKKGTRLIFSTWDRRGLLAMIASALSTMGLNISSVDAYTRSDNIVLDVFEVAEIEGDPALSETRLKDMEFLLQGMVSQPPRFASEWARVRHRVIDPPNAVPPVIQFDQSASPSSTLMTVDTQDRLGLLQDILQVIANNGLDVQHAIIETRRGRARDKIHFQGHDGRKVLDQDILKKLESGLRTVLTSKD